MFIPFTIEMLLGYENALGLKLWKDNTFQIEKEQRNQQPNDFLDAKTGGD